MQANRAFWKAVHSLSHPISILAILLLLFNDHYLRHQFPSWLTGKLGDFSWLLFAPFIAAMLFSWAFPRKPGLVGWLSIGFIGLWFGLFKTVPLVMNLTMSSLEMLVGWRGSLGMDAGDLITLPALGISWLIWRDARDDLHYLRPVGYVAFALGMMGTMATSYAPPPIYTSTICELANGHLLISEWNYESSDGGLNWQWASEEASNSIAVRCSDENRNSTENFENGTLYRWLRGERVDYSMDNGESWLLLRDLPELRQDARDLLNHDRIDNELGPSTPYRPSPVSGIVHSGTGNLVLAMSADGVLVIQPDGLSYWAAVGSNELRDLHDWDNIQLVLLFYMFLVPTLACLILVTAIVFIHRAMISWVILGWMSWFFLLISVNMPGQSTQAMLMWGMMAVISLFSIALPMSLWALYHLFKHYRMAILPIFLTAVLACFANFFPLFLWSQGTIPRYYVAMLFSVFLTAAVLAALHSYFRPKMPSRFVAEKGKRKNDAA